MSLTKFDTADRINPTKEEQAAIDTFIGVFEEHANREDVPLSYAIKDDGGKKSKCIIADWHTYLGEELNAQSLVDKEKRSNPEEDYYDIACYLSDCYEPEYKSIAAYYGNETLEIAKETNRRLEAMGSPVRVYSPEENTEFAGSAFEYFDVYSCGPECDASTQVWIVSKEELDEHMPNTAKSNREEL